MSDDKYIKDIDTIAEEDLIPNPPYVNKSPKYILIALVVLLGIVSALAVLFTADDEKPQQNSSNVENTQYII